MSIQFKFFHISSRNYSETEEELNMFLRSHRMVTIHREFVAKGENAFWSFAVEYLESPSHNGRSSGGSGKKRIDYKEVLSPEDFAVFVKLREWRKQVAEEAGVPVYTIFTNEQLAQIVTRKILSRSKLKAVEGVGSARVEKYGELITRFMRELIPAVTE